MGPDPWAGAPFVGSGGQPLHALVMGDERVRTQNRLAVRAQRPDVCPIHLVLPAPKVGSSDEVAPEARPRGLGRMLPGALDDLVSNQGLDLAAPDEEVVEPPIGPDVVVLKIEQADAGILERAAVLRLVTIDQGLP